MSDLPHSPPLSNHIVTRTKKNGLLRTCESRIRSDPVHRLSAPSYTQPLILSPYGAERAHYAASPDRVAEQLSLTTKSLIGESEKMTYVVDHSPHHVKLCRNRRHIPTPKSL